MLATAAWVGRKWGALSRAQASQAVLAHVQSLAAELPSEEQLATLTTTILAATAAQVNASRADGPDKETAEAEAAAKVREAERSGPIVATLLADARSPLAELQAALHTHPIQVVQGAARTLDALLRASVLTAAAHQLASNRPADARGYHPSIAEDEAAQMITDIFGVLADPRSYAVAAAREAAESAAAESAAAGHRTSLDHQAHEDPEGSEDPEDATPSSADHTMAAYVLDALAHVPGTTHALLSLTAPQRAVYTRLSSLRLLARMLGARGTAIRSHVLSAPGGCGEVVEHLVMAIANGGDSPIPTEQDEDLDPLTDLSGSPDVQIRAAVLHLLPDLVSGTSEIAKLIAFGGSFEALLDVIARAGRVEGGQTTHQTLSAILALLQGDAAASNGTYFRETGAVVLLPPLLFFPTAAAMCDPQRLDAFAYQPWPDTPRLAHRKENNVALVLAIADALVKPAADPSGDTAAALASGGMVACLANLACASTAPASVRSTALTTLASLIESEHARAAATRGRGATLYIEDALYNTPVAPLLPAPAPEIAIRTPPRPVPAALVDLALAGDPLARTWAGEKTFTEMLPILRAQAAAETASADEADALGLQQAHVQADIAARLADRPLRAAACQAIAAMFNTASAKLAVLGAFLPPPIEMVIPPIPLMEPLSSSKGNESTSPSPAEPQPVPMPIITPERAKAELFAGPLLGALLGPPPRETAAEDDPSVSAAAVSAAGLFAGLLSSPVGESMMAAADSVAQAKQAALEVAFDLNGQVCARPLLLHAKEMGAKENAEETDDDEDDDPREPLLQVLVARATRCLDRVSAVPPLALRTDQPLSPAGSTAEALLSLLSLWIWESPPAASMFLRESENLHALLPWRAKVSASAAAQATGSIVTQARLAGVSAFLLASVYEFDPASHGLTRTALQPLLVTEPAASEATWLIRNLAITPPTTDDPNQLPLHAQTTFARFFAATHLAAETVLLVPPTMSTEHAPSTNSEPDTRSLQTSLDAALVRLTTEAAKHARAAERARTAANEAREAHQRALEAYDQAESNAGRAIAELRVARDASQRTARVMDKRARKAARADARARQAQIQSEARAEALELAAKQERALEVQNWSVDQLLVPPRPDAPLTRLTHLVAALQARVDALGELDQRLEAPEEQQGDASSQRLVTLRQENEDLLVLLEDITQKRKAAKAILREHGHEVSDDEEDEDDATDQRVTSP